MDWIQFLSGLIVIVGANFAFMKFLLKDTHKEIEIMQKNQFTFESELKQLRQESIMTNMRLDGIYNILLEKK